MPPPARVCIACKASKTKCINFVPGKHPCDRCARIGLRCEPAPQLGMRVARKALGATLQAMLEDPSPLGPPGQPVVEFNGSAVFDAGAPRTPGEQQVMRLASDGIAMRAFQQLPGTNIQGARNVLAVMLEPGTSRSSIRFTLKPLAAIARRRNAYELMARGGRRGGGRPSGVGTEGGGGTTVLPLDEAVPLPPFDGSLPPLFENLMANSEGYVFLRTIRDGEAHFLVNSAFERSIVSVREMQQAWKSSQAPQEKRRDAAGVVEINALFTHPEDLQSVYRMIGQLYRQCQEDVVAQAQCERPVRVYDRLAGSYSFFDVSGRLLVDWDGRIVTSVRADAASHPLAAPTAVAAPTALTAPNGFVAPSPPNPLAGRPPAAAHAEAVALWDALRAELPLAELASSAG
ncbi:hypothetical protein EMIHUDRAFT_457502 [Emiliania huxleyi CCMP1516]|uniref:Zn(2)-C6 fungal-type domain-containing protein n=2 Tax=Emiliania huxleyi TaxID=2903 RepID=A0A0D3JPZ9_EMIH1|nr:hypothetical protein EMIHUDRAFT_457502 [Emiliania huxleyi CCMP1516]EOD25584.1 hypothetical protein EMIHUDRAFT_457502 [Emiliania huxleyi CCMP1516]|eukprot:XP_005778013.1 hypothetical protein EMIHUDRAFT_457502 [Emiliania huxleyi CCMP1516]